MICPQSSYPAYTAVFTMSSLVGIHRYCWLTLKKSRINSGFEVYSHEIRRAIGVKKHIHVVHEGVSSMFYRVRRKGKSFLAMATLVTKIQKNLQAYAQLPFIFVVVTHFVSFCLWIFQKVDAIHTTGIDDLVLVQQPSLSALVALYNEALRLSTSL